MDTSNRAISWLLRETGLYANRRETFADDTSTGRLAKARGLRRAIVTASVEGRDYDWWLQFKRDYFPGVPEVKSKDVLPLVRTSPEARHRLLQGCVNAKTVIVIIDFSEFTASLVRDVYKAAGLELDADPLDILDQGRLPADVTEAILRFGRRAGLEQSAVSRIEWLFGEALAEAPVILFDEPDLLVDRDAFDRLDSKAKAIFISYFSVVFGEALDPRRQADLIAKRFERLQSLEGWNFAYERLEYALTADRVFDQGSGRAFGLLTDAHGKMVGALEKAMYTQIGRRAGGVKEDDSRNALGIQVADVAAGCAAHEYEAAPGEVREKAARVRTMFDRVLLNDEWL